jgi:hypothetical protein
MTPPLNRAEKAPSEVQILSPRPQKRGRKNSQERASYLALFILTVLSSISTANVQVRFEPDTDHELEAIAREHGLKKATLIRTWVLDRLRILVHVNSKQGRLITNGTKMSLNNTHVPTEEKREYS